ncbi:protein DDI1 homolog 2 isoform X1 [Callorhinchus milii]|uniref:protein DDI1 homolog 2 isoform X1 n=1 Tax=Callorhinchus milii TaxID=7868 RepID=UPI001C3FD247|nr:protein DDI1 homolog 2 isoform X1 [Callorhinchus milii]
MFLTVYCVRRDLSELTFTLQVDGGLELETLRALCELESGVPAAESQILFAEHALTDNRRTLEAYGLKDGDVVVLRQLDRPQVQTGLQLPGASGLPRIDFSSISVPGASVPSRPPTGTSVQQLPNPASTSATSSPPPVPTQHGLENNPTLLRDMLLANPHELSLLKERNPPLAEALLSGDLEKFTKVLREQQSERARREQERIRLLNADPFDLEAQAKIEEDIRQQNIEENMTIAMEESPESFGQVVMLYINCKVNGHPVKAFVDSGAQMTIMSQACAERCNIMRLVDRRWAGIAKGVGTQKIIGRVHLAQVQIEGDFLPCSFSILEDQPMDMLLGLDMLKRHQCSIDLKRDVVVIGTTGTETRFLPEAELPECARLAYGIPRDDLRPEEMADQELAEALQRSSEESGNENGKTTSLETPSLLTPHPNLPLPTTGTGEFQAPYSQSQLDHSVSVPASLPLPKQNESDFRRREDLQMPECAETQAENQLLPGPSQCLSDHLLALPSPDHLSVPSQATLRGKHTPHPETLRSSSQNPSRQLNTDTDETSVPKSFLPDITHPREFGKETRDCSVPSVRAKPQLESPGEEGCDLEAAPMRQIEDISSDAQPYPDPTKSSQTASPQLTLGDCSSNDHHLQEHVDSDKGADGDLLEEATEPLVMDLEIHERDLNSCCEKTAVCERTSTGNSSRTAECFDAVMEVSATDQQAEESDTATEMDSSDPKEGRVMDSDQDNTLRMEFEETFLKNSSSSAANNSGEVSSRSHKGEAAQSSDEMHVDAHLSTDMKPPSQQGTPLAPDCDPNDSSLSPVAALIELHQQLVSKCHEADFNVSAAEGIICRPEAVSQGERVQPMEACEESLTDGGTASEMCHSAEQHIEVMEVAEQDPSEKRDEDMECSDRPAPQVVSEVRQDAQDVAQEILTREAEHEAVPPSVLVSENMTKQADVPPAKGIPENQPTSPKIGSGDVVRTPASATDNNDGQISQHTAAELQVPDIALCSSEISAARMPWERTMEANVDEPNTYCRESSPLDRGPTIPSLPIFPAANIEQIRRSGFTEQEAIEALERSDGDTELALLLLLARQIVVPV